jgi:hypothetical protein
MFVVHSLDQIWQLIILTCYEIWNLTVLYQIQGPMQYAEEKNHASVDLGTKQQEVERGNPIRKKRIMPICKRIMHQLSLVLNT